MEQKNHEKETRVFTKEQKEKTRRRLNRLIRTRETVSRMKPREGENPTAYAERSSSESIRRRLEDQERELRRRLRKRRQEQKQERRNRRARRRQWKKQQKTETIRPSSGKTGRGSFPHAPGPAGRASGMGSVLLRRRFSSTKQFFAIAHSHVTASDSFRNPADLEKARKNASWVISSEM